jgi:hypothetical protein
MVKRYPALCSKRDDPATFAFVIAAVRSTVLPVIALLAWGATAWAAQPVKEHVDLKVVSRSDGGTRFVHTGSATGTFAGSVRSKITLAHSVVLSGVVTIRAKGGTVTMKVNGRARSLSVRTKFNGTAAITGGTGKYAHAKGTGQFTGVVNRSTWHATIDATGSFTS